MDQFILSEQRLSQIDLDLSHRMAELRKLREAVHIAEALQASTAQRRAQPSPSDTASYTESRLAV
ncbi:hypothetical protein [Bradyrhizobium retamae]|uniref:hypothetical protein n=1 Tax=Bradyrhizobium retamae TaxID=1300035 RepID=UPI000A400E38|nr:hypothetical protein [Bradyrhizobium retamae]